MDDEARRWQQRAREFAAEWIAPASLREWESDAAARMPWDVIEAGSAAGFRTCAVPPEFGGPNPPLTRLAMALVIEEFATADPGIAHYFAHAMKDVLHVVRMATPAQKQAFFPEFVADPRYLTANASTEPGHGGDRYLPTAGFHLDTVAVRDGESWVINGRKHCIAGGNESRLVLLQAATDTAQPYDRGTTTFMLFRGDPGMRQGVVHDKVGLRMLNNAEIVLEDCRVGDDRVLGTVGRAVGERRGQAVDNGILSVAMKLGIARAAFDTALEHAKHRVQGGKVILEHQAVGLKLAEIAAQVELLRALMHRYAAAGDGDESVGPLFGDVSTWLGVEAGFKAAVLGLQVCGCQGTWLAHRSQKHVRDAMLYFPNDGTHTIHLLRAQRKLLAAAGLSVSDDAQ